ncbi:hypothetical protein G6F37_008515 [Rhizopus arrhizus]|nr:hypothetical protein G6F38_008634 [Rhizopus arrhizus]KAG1155465.1 hypothetical protein G6F37_008515 [Rhizopus arrhizus]
MIEKIEDASLQFEENARIIKKRTFEALQDISENIIDNVVETSKRLHSQINDGSARITRKSSIEETSALFQEMTGLKALDIDDEGIAVVMDESVLAELRQKTSFKPYSLSIATASLLELISKDNTSLLVLRDIIKSYQLPTSELFDLLQHTDVTFIETVGLYFVNLALSPRNPLHFQTLERTTAVQTSIFFLNSLFLSANDRINFNWIEIETFLTGKTKWDGVGFCPIVDKKIGVALVEFSGGILWNKTKNKIDKDTKKIEKGVIDFIEYTSMSPGHFIRCHGLELHFEVIFLIDGNYFKRTWAVLKFPTSPMEFKNFFNKMPKIFEWRQSLLDSITQLSSKF